MQGRKDGWMECRAEEREDRRLKGRIKKKRCKIGREGRVDKKTEKNEKTEGRKGGRQAGTY
jgi:hypothetical protein